MVLQQSLKSLFKKIAYNRAKPNLIRLYIEDTALQGVYAYLLKDEVKNKIQQAFKNAQASGKPLTYRIEKSNQTCARTLTILQDLNGDLIPILETKSKLAYGKKREKGAFAHLEGGNKNGKSCWRIDCYPPVKWINQLPIKRTKLKAHEIVEEALLSQKIAQAAMGQQEHTPVNYSLLGPSWRKGKAYQQSAYSPMAETSLRTLLKEKWVLSDKDKNRIAQDILLGVQAMHKIGMIHQDIKPGNILITPSKEGYRAKLTDFGITKSNKNAVIALATIGYESPEISQFHYYDDSAQGFHKYFHTGKKPNKSLGRQLALETLPTKEDCAAFAHPHKANDIWAIGQTLKELYGETNTLIQKMLAPKREDRMTIEESLAYFQPASPIEPKPLDKINKKQVYLPAYRFNKKEHNTTKEEQGCFMRIRKTVGRFRIRLS